MKNLRSWLRTVSLVACVLSLTACSLSFARTSSNSYALTWHPGVSGFPDVTLTLTPVIPPKALDLKPSNYVQVDLKVGSNFEFSTDDPKYQCLETVAATTLPILFAPEGEVISGFEAVSNFLVIYQACGQFLQTSPVKLASSVGAAAQELIFFQITGQKMVSQTANGQELSPLNLPAHSNAPTPTPTIPPPPLPTVQILSPTADASYTFTHGGSFSLILESVASQGVISYAWTDTLHLVNDSNGEDTLQVTPDYNQVPCDTPVSDTISLTVTDSYGQTAKAEVTITIKGYCIK
jgi:hypothetical protein